MSKHIVDGKTWLENEQIGSSQQNSDNQNAQHFRGLKWLGYNSSTDHISDPTPFSQEQEFTWLHEVSMSYPQLCVFRVFDKVIFFSCLCMWQLSWEKLRKWIRCARMCLRTSYAELTLCSKRLRRHFFHCKPRLCWIWSGLLFMLLIVSCLISEIQRKKHVVVILSVFLSGHGTDV